MINDIDHKICNKCEEWLPATTEYFYENKLNGIDGLFPFCKKCNIKKSWEWIVNNRERFEESRRNGYFKTEKFRKWSRKNFIQMKEYNKEWRKLNKDKIKQYNLERAHKSHDITNEELLELYDYADHSCMYCGRSEDEALGIYEQKLHKDHAYNEGSNGIDNCILACKGCNCRKHTKDWDEWYTEDNPLYDETRFWKITKWLERFD